MRRWPVGAIVDNNRTGGQIMENCKEMVRGEGQWGSFHRHRCNHNAKRDGYCGTHHPDAVKRRREKSDSYYEKAIAENNARAELEAFNRRAGDRCRELGIEPEGIEV